MTFENELYGKVVDISDPKKLGRIKCEILGRTDGIPKEHLPWYLPRRSKDYHDLPKLEELVHIRLMDDDILIGYWKLLHSSELLELSDDDYESAKVLMYRDLADWEDEGILNISYTKTDGLMIQLQESKINIRREGTIHLFSELLGKQIDISETQISLGSVGESLEPAVMGDQNVTAHEMQADYTDWGFTEISKACQDLANACTNPYTLPLKPLFMKLSQLLKSQSPKKSKEIKDFLPETLSLLVSLDKEA